VYRRLLIVALILMQFAAADSGAVCSCDQTGISLCWLEFPWVRSSTVPTRTYGSSGCNCANGIGDAFDDTVELPDSALSNVDQPSDSGDVRSDSSRGRGHRKIPRHLAFSRGRGAAVGTAFGRAILASLPAGPVLTSGQFEQVVDVVRPPRAMDSRMAWLSTVVIRC